MEQRPILNEHNKTEFPPMHTAEHILNQTMIRMFSCDRSKTNHIEKKKSKCDYKLSFYPTNEQIQAIEDKVNEIINRHLDITTEFININEAAKIFDLTRLPEDATETLRIVKVGDYDACPCIGMHVNNTSEIGTFKIVSYDYDEGRLRLRFKLL